MAAGIVALYPLRSRRNVRVIFTPARDTNAIADATSYRYSMDLGLPLSPTVRLQI